MSEKVVALPGHSIPHPGGAPVPEVVASLERALNEARQGILVAVAIAGVVDDGTGSPMSAVAFQCAPGQKLRLENSLMRLVRSFGAWLDQ